MAYLKNMRVGYVNFVYLAPPEITDPVDQLLWQMDEMHKLDCHAMHPLIPRPPVEGEGMEKVLQKMKEYDIEFDIQCPRAIFEMTGADPEGAKKEILETIELAKKYGSKIIRCGYGMNNTATTRCFKAPGIHAHELLRMIADNLKAAAPLFEENGVLFALENHCDFKGTEIAWIMEEVNSPNVGVAYDIGNAIAVLCDPNDDIDVLAPWTFTTHVKDSKMIDSPFGPSYFPMIPVGCVVGEGYVDIDRAIKTIAEKAPYPEGLHLLYESAWPGALPEGTDPRLRDIEVTKKSVEYIKKVITID